MDRQPIKTDVSYVNLLAHVIATIVLAVSAAMVAWVFLFTSPDGSATTHAHHGAVTR